MNFNEFANEFNEFDGFVGMLMICLDSFRRVLLMLWILHVKTDPPKWMRHDPEIQGRYEGTYAMLRIKHVKTEPPEWMRHDPGIQGRYEGTCAMLWIACVNTDPPEWMRHDPEIKDINNKHVFHYGFSTLKRNFLSG